MKIYWSDRQGKAPPPNAEFFCRCFLPDAPAPFQGKAAWIDSLPRPSSVKVLRRSYLPDREEWVKSVQRILARKIEKTVLARCQILDLAERPDPFSLAASLQSLAEGAYVFCVSDGEAAFLGATPERLFFREGNRLLSEAMAGTRLRGRNPQEDETLGRELLGSAKDLRELTPVQTFLKTALAPLCEEEVHFDPISLHKTQNVQHLYAPCTAKLQRGVSDQEILDRIHPTPALCGSPVQEAFDLIQELEPFERGLYGGALGWDAQDSSEWIVGIRSCFIRGKQAYLYTGTGIVEGSNPEEEWEELNHKGRLYDRIFL